MRSIVRLAMGSYFQLAKAIGAPVMPFANSTLNEMINNSDIVPFQPANPLAGMELASDYNYVNDSAGTKMQYIAIGSGGHFAICNATNGRPKMDTKPHLARHTGFFDLMPFVLRDPSNDLTTQQREKYRLRKVLNVGGQTKIGYFLRVLDLSSAPITQNIIKKENGVVSSTPYQPTAQDANPSDPVISGGNDGTYLQTLVQVDIAFDAQEAAWLREVAELWYGDANDAIVSEIAVCSGVDKPIVTRYPYTGNISPSPVNSGLKEAVCVQLNMVESVYHAMTFNNGSVTEKIFIGTEDPLYGNQFTTP